MYTVFSIAACVRGGLFAKVLPWERNSSDGGLLPREGQSSLKRGLVGKNGLCAPYPQQSPAMKHLWSPALELLWLRLYTHLQRSKKFFVFAVRASKNPLLTWLGS